MHTSYIISTLLFLCSILFAHSGFLSFSFNKTMATRVDTQVSNRYKKTVLLSKQTSSKRIAQNTRFVDFRFKLSAWSGFLPMRLLKHFADKVAGTVCLGMASTRARPSRNDSSSRRSMPYVPAGDSHRDEAIEDCIEFFNSSSTFSRATPIASQVSS